MSQPAPLHLGASGGAANVAVAATVLVIVPAGALAGRAGQIITLWKDVVRFTLQTIRFSVSRFPKKHNLLFPKTFGSFGTCTEKCTEFSQNHN